MIEALSFVSCSADARFVANRNGALLSRRLNDDDCGGEGSARDGDRPREKNRRSALRLLLLLLLVLLPPVCVRRVLARLPDASSLMCTFVASCRAANELVSASRNESQHTRTTVVVLLLWLLLRGSR